MIGALWIALLKKSKGVLGMCPRCLRDTEMASVIINAILMFVEKYFYGLAVVVAARYRPFGRVLCGRGGKTLHPTVDSSASRCRQK
jgi:hypothetical protein